MKRISILFILIFLMFSINTGLSAAPADSVSVSIGGATGVPNETVNVPITVSSDSNLQIISYEIDIQFDPTFLDTAGVDLVGTLSDGITIQKNIYN